MPSKFGGLFRPPEFPSASVSEQVKKDLKPATGEVGQGEVRARGLMERFLFFLCVMAALWNVVHTLVVASNKVYEPVVHGSSMAAMAAAVGIYWTHRGDHVMYCLSVLVMLMMVGLGSATLAWELSDLSLGLALPDSTAHLGFPAQRSVVYSGGGAAQASSALQSRFGLMGFLFMLGVVLAVYTLAYTFVNLVHMCRMDIKRVSNSATPAAAAGEADEESPWVSWADEGCMSRWFPEEGADDVYLCCIPTKDANGDVGKRCASAGVMHWLAASLSWGVLACVAAGAIQFMQRKDVGMQSAWLMTDTYAVPIAMLAGARAFSRPDVEEGPWTLLGLLVFILLSAVAHIVAFGVQVSFYRDVVGCELGDAACMQTKSTVPYTYGLATVTNVAPPASLGQSTVDVLNVDIALLALGASLYIVLVLQCVFLLVVKGGSRKTVKNT